MIISSSRYWFNYYHVVIAVSFYNVLKQHGVDDDHIILMLADEYAVNPVIPLADDSVASLSSPILTKSRAFGSSS